MKCIRFNCNHGNLFLILVFLVYLCKVFFKMHLYFYDSSVRVKKTSHGYLISACVKSNRILWKPDAAILTFWRFRVFVLSFNRSKTRKGENAKRRKREKARFLTQQRKIPTTKTRD